MSYACFRLSLYVSGPQILYRIFAAPYSMHPLPYRVNASREAPYKEHSCHLRPPWKTLARNTSNHQTNFVIACHYSFGSGTCLIPDSKVFATKIYLGQKRSNKSFSHPLCVNVSETEGSDRGYLYFLKLRNQVKGCADWKKACELGERRNYNLAKLTGLCP
jgi:hypothetical protein